MGSEMCIRDSFGLHGQTGQKIAEEWFRIVSENTNTVNEEDCDTEHGLTVKHRHDQSVFSLVLKSMGLKPNMKPLKSEKGSGKLMRRIKFLTEPVLASRNRTGRSVAS